MSQHVNRQSLVDPAVTSGPDHMPAAAGAAMGGNGGSAHDSVAWARERFLEAGDVPPVGLRAGIVESWRRSRLSGVDSADLDPPYVGDVDADDRLLRAARPVLDRLAETLLETWMSLVVCDAGGRVLHRRVADRSLLERLDEVRLAPGFSYAEEYVGTNGMGTALETRRVSYVSGSEHFNERLHALACAASPIWDRLTGRLTGLLNVTWWNKDADPLAPVVLPALVHNAADAIEQRLLELGAERERALFTEFLAVGRHAGRPAVTLSDDLMMANRQATELLAPADHPIVRDRAAELLRSGESSGQVTLSHGEVATLRCRPIGTHAAVVEIDLADVPRPTPRPLVQPACLRLAGKSVIFSKVCAELLAWCRSGVRVLVEGEPGSGKLALVEAVHRACAPGGSLVVIEPDQRVEEVAARLDQVLSSSSVKHTVVLRHPERFTPAVLTAITVWLDSISGCSDRLWLVATATGDAELPDDLLRGLPVTLTVPPLRHRIDDLRELVPVLLRRFAGHRAVSCGPAAMRVLLRAPWPGNVAELEHALRHALTRRRAGQIRPEDLPESCHVTSRRVLTQWETLERDAIVRALLETDGDKVEAADLLGISRATIYRKINSYGISVLPHGSR
ncbi:sigma-54-dependent Fis family transcriptional regulator [Actinoallomurus rhizosphaericola]|uniref:sigma-54-dependent Fis family transcriptional regulator n=1 Tax=Actinoallomurus rhizosphaericola TaxID=2952536 RepID=UPI0020926209|nr:helix-turn-helix domain-containing protein [Actinoallomurus rhizosphaericola]MCO6000107.1 hypothetical protein [Actinoallomurus rhizosphaericola]